MIETLKIPDSVTFGGESPYESLQDAVQFWTSYLSNNKVWSEEACNEVYDQLIQTVMMDIEGLTLSYKVERVSV
jgi:hypothetical protein